MPSTLISLNANNKHKYKVSALKNIFYMTNEYVLVVNISNTKLFPGNWKDD